MIEVKVSYDRDLEVARKACEWWAALALTPEEKEGVEDPVEMERLADNALDRAHTRFIVSDDPQEIVDEDQALHRPRLHRAGLPLPGQRPAPLHRRVRRRRDAAPAMTLRDPRRALQRAASSRRRGSTTSTTAAAGPRAPRTSPRTARWSGRTSRTTGSCATTRRPAASACSAQPAGYTNGHTVDRAGPAGQLRARRAARHPHRARRHDHRARRQPTTASGSTAPTTSSCAPTARSTSPTRRTGSRAATRATRPSREIDGCHVYR